MQTYLDALKTVAINLRNQTAALATGTSYVDAANVIYRESSAGNLEITGAVGDPSCEDLSMAQTFHQFLMGKREECGIVPLADNLIEYFNNNMSSSDYKDFYYAPSPYLSIAVHPERPVKNSELMTGYFPGTRQGAKDDGDIFKTLAVVVSLLNPSATTTPPSFLLLKKLRQGEIILWGE